MEFILKDQSVQFTFAGEKYSNGKKSRILKNVKKQASAEEVMKVGNALSKLQLKMKLRMLWTKCVKLTYL